MNFESVYKQYEPMIFAVMRKLNIFTDYEEYYQVGLIALWQALEQYKGPVRNVNGYIYRTIYYDMIEEIRRQSRKQSHEQIQEQIPDILWHEPTEEMLLLQQILQTLCLEDREIVQAFYIHQLTDEQIARKIGKNKDAVKKKRQRAIMKLKNRLVKGELCSI